MGDDKAEGPAEDSEEKGRKADQQGEGV